MKVDAKSADLIKREDHLYSRSKNITSQLFFLKQINSLSLLSLGFLIILSQNCLSCMFFF